MGKRKRTPAEEAAIACGDVTDSGTAEVDSAGSESGTKPEETLRVKSAAPSLALVPSAEVITSAEILTSKVRELRQHLATSAANYALACEVAAEIKDRHWRQTKDEHGKQYRSWEDYARRSLAPALGLKSPTAIYGMIKVVAEGLVPDVHAFGSTVARALASLPEARRPEVRALAIEGAPTDEIKARTTAILDEEHAKQASHAADKGEAPRKRMGRPAGSGKSQRKREEESRKSATTTNEQALSELASKGLEARSFCFDVAADETITVESGRRADRPDVVYVTLPDRAIDGRSIVVEIDLASRDAVRAFVTKENDE